MGKGDVDRLTEAFESGRLVRPSAEEPNFVDFVRALARLTGVEDLPCGPNAEAICDLIGQADHLVLVLVDGLGTDLLPSLPAGGLLRRHLVQGLRTVFPSTTASALTTLATGHWPAAHAVAGWWTYLPDRDISAISLPFVERFGGRPLSELGVAAEEMFPVPGFWGRMQRDALSVLPAGLTGSVYSRYCAGAGPRAGYATMAEGFDIVSRRVIDADRPTFTYLYLPQVDALAHRQGVAAEGMPALLAEVEALMARLTADMAGRARLVVTADHGLVDVPAPRRFVIDQDDPLLAELRCPPTGEPVVPLLHARCGGEEALAGKFAERFGGHFALLTPEEAEQLHLFGPGGVSPALRARLGSGIGIALEPSAIYYKPPGAEAKVHVGVHAGLSPQEMHVPLIIVR